MKIQKKIVNNMSIDQVYFIDLFLFSFLNKRMQVGVTQQGPLKWPLIIMIKLALFIQY